MPTTELGDEAGSMTLVIVALLAIGGLFALFLSVGRSRRRAFARQGIVTDAVTTVLAAHEVSEYSLEVTRDGQEVRVQIPLGVDSGPIIDKIVSALGALSLKADINVTNA